MASVYTEGSLFDVLLDCSQFVESAKERGEAGLSRADLLDGLERRLSLALGKLAAVPTCTSFCLYTGPIDG